MNNQAIIKYLEGAASQKEREEVLEWIEKSPENKDEYISLKKVWALTSKGNEDKETAWKDFYPQIRKASKKLVYKRFFRQAAVFILLFGLGVLSHYFITNKSRVGTPLYSKSCSVQAPLGQMTNLELPDGTIVILNSGSKLSYQSGFSYGNRKVVLEGEAFFDVKKDKGHPFIVKSSLLDVKVYGTSFNIQAYPEDKTFNATLVEGSISVLNKEGIEVTILEPGQKANYNDGDANVVINEVDAQIYTSWKKGLVTFRGEKLKDIAKKIERWYNVEIEIQDPALGEESYFGTILKNKPIDQILEVFKLTTSLEYEIIPQSDKPTKLIWK